MMANARSPASHAAFAILAVLAAALLARAFLLNPFIYEHGWVSSHFAIMARNFYEHGVMALGGVPVQSSGVLLDKPDHYLHWPPLSSIVMGWLAWPFGGVSEAFVHTLAVVLVLSQAAVLGFWLSVRVSRLCGIAAAIVFLNLPVVVRFAHLGLHLHLCFLLSLVSIVLLDFARSGQHNNRTYLFSGAVFYYLACMTSWEPLLMAPGLALVWALAPNRADFMRFALYGIAGALAVATIVLLYWLREPALFDVLFSAIRFRASILGAQDLRQGDMFALANVLKVEAGIDRLRHFHRGLQNLALLGTIGWAFLLAQMVLVLLTIGALAGRWTLAGQRVSLSLTGGMIWALLPLTTMPLFWMVLLPQHFAIHNYQALVFALPVAMIAGLCAHKAYDFLAPGRTVIFWLAALLAGLILIFERIDHDVSVFSTRQYAAEIELGRTLKTEIPANGIVLAPWYHMVTGWYANRHIVRGILDESHVALARAQISRDCRDCRVYRIEKEASPAKESVAPDVKPLPGGWFLREYPPFQPDQDRNK